MAFSQATITSASASRVGAELDVSWVSSSPEGTIFQVYVARRLAWAGTERSVALPWPGSRGANIPIDVGTVDPADEHTDYSSTLPAIAGTFASLAWQGGYFESATLAGFNVFMSSSPGAAVNYAAAVATIPAYVAGRDTSGWGMGGWDEGGWGSAAGNYSWTSGSLEEGVWSFAVAAFDVAGNQDPAPPTVSVTIAAPPRPPAADPGGARLAYTYNASTYEATLAWLASP